MLKKFWILYRGNADYWNKGISRSINFSVTPESECIWSKFTLERNLMNVAGKMCTLKIQLYYVFQKVCFFSLRLKCKLGLWWHLYACIHLQLTCSDVCKCSFHWLGEVEVGILEGHSVTVWELFSSARHNKIVITMLSLTEIRDVAI